MRELWMMEMRKSVGELDVISTESIMSRKGGKDDEWKGGIRCKKPGNSLIK